MKVILKLLCILFFINLISALPACSDTNEIDISEIPCTGFTMAINCSGNISAFNVTNSSINYSIEITNFVDDVYNFTFNLSEGEYELLDCDNNTATVIVGLIDQGYGMNLWIIIIPSLLLSFGSLLISAKLFKSYGDDDENRNRELYMMGDNQSFIPRSRLIPVIFLLFSFVPMIFMVGFVNGHLEEYFPTANITSFYGTFYILFTTIFYAVFLFSFIIWAATFIRKIKIKKGIIDENY
jgi:hypothetical protein